MPTIVLNLRIFGCRLGTAGDAGRLDSMPMKTTSRPSDAASALPPATTMTAIGLIYFLMAFGGVFMTRVSDEIAVLWLASGFLLAILLSTQRRRWPALVVICVIANFTADMLNDGNALVSFSLSLCAPGEALLIALMLRPSDQVRFDLLQPALLLRAGLVSGLITSFIAALGSTILLLEDGVPFANTFPYWLFADLLGIALITPLTLSLCTREIQALFIGANRIRTWSVLGLVVLTCCIVFGQARLPALLFMVFPPMLLAAFRLGLAGNALAVCILGALSIGLTLAGFGPMAKAVHIAPAMILHLQFFLVVVLITTFPVATVVEARRKLLQKLAINERRYRLLADNASDAILHIGLDGAQNYVSPRLTQILGWTSEELADGSITDHVHPDHVWNVQNVLASLTAGSEREVLSYLCQCRDRSYVWIETGFSLVRDPVTGMPAEIVAVVRDVSERKQVEDRLAEANRHLQMLASTDSLTGIANRRRFDLFLTEEWRRSMRTRCPIALLLIDIDWFKALNDFYGHQVGDECLRRVAGAVAQMARRPGDLAARYGGEEFALVLGETDVASAKVIADLLAERIAALQVAHGGSTHGVVTVSIGLSSVIPSYHQTEAALLEAADRALYEAKGSGRNRVCIQSPRPPVEIPRSRTA
jgi:diguanylate cyclase (GGDEF)-like protein/PAS domain S-box-containing protein